MNTGVLGSESEIMASPQNKPRFLVSACLAGISCTYKAEHNSNKLIQGMYLSGACLLVCPEVMGGLSIPRARMEIIGGSGLDVLNKKARIVNENGDDVTKECLKGVRTVVRLAGKYRIKKAILKSNSPCCGKGRIYDGSFKNVARKGDGVLTAALKGRGVKVYSEKEFIEGLGT